VHRLKTNKTPTIFRLRRACRLGPRIRHVHVHRDRRNRRDLRKKLQRFVKRSTFLTKICYFAHLQEKQTVASSDESVKSGLNSKWNA